VIADKEEEEEEAWIILHNH